MLWLHWLELAAGITYDPSDLSSMQTNVGLIVEGMLDYYPISNGNAKGATIGVFQEPYYWWEAGVAWGILIDCQYMLDVSNYTSLIKAALVAQAGSAGDFMPTNQSLVEGNDDQAFWGMAAMTAAERNFSNPDDDSPGWLYCAEAVYADMKSRWDTANCDGGLRWQIYTWNSGYDYKNTVSNGALFALGARLAHYTHNSSYADFAEEVYDWLVDVGFVDNGSAYDGADTSDNCTDLTKNQWSYNSGLMLSGCAYMYSYNNGSGDWEDRAKLYWSAGSSYFFENDVAYEHTCNLLSSCNNDQRVFKGIYLQQLGQTAQLIPSMSDEIMTAMNATASAAAGSCSGGTDGHTCGMDWVNGTYDGVYGVGEQIDAIAALTQSLVLSKDAPYSAYTGGSSNESDSGSATSSTSSSNPLDDDKPVTTGDRAGAGVLTAILMIFLVGVGVWIIL